MEQNGIAIISPQGVMENSVGKSKSIGITFRSNGAIRSAKEKLKAPWLKKTEEEEDSTWDKSMAVLGELIGTTILIFLGCMACMGSMKPYISGTGPSMIQISFAFGLAVMIAIQCVGHISGAHLNPAITIAALILGKKSLIMAGFYTIAQCLGALLGYGLLKMITPSDLVHNGDSTTTDKFCTTDVNEAIGIGHGIAAEAFATGVLVFFACSSWDSRNAKNTDSLGLKFGLCVSMLCLAFIPHTGCSMNPARSFGPAVWTGHWHYHWLYWLGPIGGSIIATLIYRCLFLKNQENTQDVETLNDIET
ncbi:PREDICTED: aquaporin AQPAe.a-like [Trachymyrmex cornetzi]|uniref:Aquaporin AQPAe.a n=1 Tax=Trachymyrmex cornetzi TaxID=471704 RepID=A0A151J3T1_9HYME|nr:PREDICTED: aquaporin AQPAe.a-like [Trachymyrmex cornetzi]KYN17063.1 Aquaporin AQPAe.a [Trachymyrmex cornetzi]